MDISLLYKLYLQNPSISTDTRKIKHGDIFFALLGPNFNGNDYVQQALASGASFCIANGKTSIDDARIIRVKDTLQTLHDLALHHRRQLNIPFIAITGSNGKTTTKELVNAVLSTTYRTYTTQGNLNNHIGVPLTILSVNPDAEMAIIEMGANHAGEIRSYCEYTLPTHGIITNCGKAHLEGFGSVEGVQKAKGELFDHLRENKGTAFICNDHDYLVKMSDGIPTIITYGMHSAMNTGTVADGELLKVILDSGEPVQTKLVGEYNLHNVLAAVTIGRNFSIPDKTIIQGIENYIPSNSRSQLMEKNGNHYILDAYNANPSSMQAAIDNFSKRQGTNKILILGAMKELGPDSAKEHQFIIDLLKRNEWEKVILIGSEFENLAPDFLHFQNADQARQWFSSQQFNNRQVLIKGSRSMNLEKVLE